MGLLGKNPGGWAPLPSQSVLRIQMSELPGAPAHLQGTQVSRLSTLTHQLREGSGGWREPRCPAPISAHLPSGCKEL